MVRQQPAAADAELRVPGRAGTPLISFMPGPDAAGILPAASRAAEPLAEDRPRGNLPALRFRSASRSAFDLRVARMHTVIRLASRFVETASRDPWEYRSRG